MTKSFPLRKSSWKKAVAIGSSALTAAGVLGLQVSSPLSGAKLSSASVQVAPYVDMTLWPLRNLSQIATDSQLRSLTLAFIVSNKGTCSPSWGNYYPVGQNNGSFLSNISGFQSMGGNPIISFGGEANQEMALVCPSAQALEQQYQYVVDHYHVYSLDFDIEGTALNDQASIQMRNEALAMLQRDEAAMGHNITISYTLPVMPWGLLSNSLYLLNNAAASGVNVSVVNVMAMDYGLPNPQNQMGNWAVQAAQATEAQLAKIWPQKSSSELWSMVGLTPMIGQNDLSGEIFTPQDASQVYNFAVSQGLGRLSYWSAERDFECSGGADVNSNTCSGVVQSPYEFASLFMGATTTTQPPSTTTTQPPSTTTTVAQESNATLSVTVSRNSTWWGGYSDYVTLTNNSSSKVQGWKVSFSLDGANVADLWDGVVSEPNQGSYQVTPASWNQVIEPGGSVKFGFVVKSDSKVAPNIGPVVLN